MKTLKNNKNDDPVKKLLTPQTITLLNMIKVIIFAAGLGAGMALVSSLMGIIILIAAAVLLVVQVYEKAVHG